MMWFVFGLNVTVISTSISKREEALTLLGADKFVISSDQEQMAVKYTCLLGGAWFCRLIGCGC